MKYGIDVILNIYKDVYYRGCKPALFSVIPNGYCCAPSPTFSTL